MDLQGIYETLFIWAFLAVCTLFLNLVINKFAIKNILM